MSFGKAVALQRLLRNGVDALRGNGGTVKNENERKLLAIAIECCIEANRFNWYDSKFLRHFEAAKKFLGIVLPGRVEQFVSGFEVLRTHPGFQLQYLDPVFDSETFQELIETVRTLPYFSLEHHENETFGRHLIRRHPLFTRLQSSLTERMSDLVGEAVSPAYNFLSLYGGLGRCDPHLDQPLSKWTLDICIEQSVDWPISFSQVVDWPSECPESGTTIEALRSDPSLRFESVVLKPNSGAIFSGSSQWHFREAIDGRKTDYCHLLFLHYLPKGAESLADPKQWATHFDMPELRILAAADNMVMTRAQSVF